MIPLLLDGALYGFGDSKLGFLGALKPEELPGGGAEDVKEWCCGCEPFGDELFWNVLFIWSGFLRPVGFRVDGDICRVSLRGD